MLQLPLTVRHSVPAAAADPPVSKTSHPPFYLWTQVFFFFCVVYRDLRQIERGFVNRSRYLHFLQYCNTKSVSSLWDVSGIAVRNFVWFRWAEHETLRCKERGGDLWPKRQIEILPRLALPPPTTTRQETLLTLLLLLPPLQGLQGPLLRPQTFLETTSARE